MPLYLSTDRSEVVVLFLLGQICRIVLFNHLGNNCGLNSCFYNIYMAKNNKYSRIQILLSVHMARFAYMQNLRIRKLRFAYMQIFRIWKSGKNAFTWPGLLT